jgi:hypothetical protein
VSSKVKVPKNVNTGLLLKVVEIPKLNESGSFREDFERQGGKSLAVSLTYTFMQVLGTISWVSHQPLPKDTFCLF